MPAMPETMDQANHIFMLWLYRMSCPLYRVLKGNGEFIAFWQRS
ncbi:MAG: hypothetical protein JWO78_2172 [Micavibrio sp.]|nr:hypothetical protein [Micavibrio sp.]